MGRSCEVVELSKSNLVLGSRGSGTVGLVDALSDPVGSFLGGFQGGLNIGRVWADHGSVVVF